MVGLDTQSINKATMNGCYRGLGNEEGATSMEEASSNASVSTKVMLGFMVRDLVQLKSQVKKYL